MNNKITTNETMSKMAEATRLRTRRLLRFSERYNVLFSSLILLMLGMTSLFEAKFPAARWPSICFILFLAGIMIMYVVTSIRKKKLMHAERRFSNERRRIVVFIIFLLAICALYVFDQNAPLFLKNYVSNNCLLLLFPFGIIIFNSFLETHLPEELIASIVCFGISVASIAWPFHNIFLGLLVTIFIIAFIQMLLGCILWIRWQRSAKQISDGNQEEKIT